MRIDPFCECFEPALDAGKCGNMERVTLLSNMLPTVCPMNDTLPTAALELVHVPV